jgi:hypothetical protein
MARYSTVRAGEVFREAWRNTLSGTSKLFVWAVALSSLLGVLAWFDTSQSVGLINQSAERIKGGGATWVIESPGQIDGAACDALSEIPAIRSSGAARKLAEPVTIVSLPSAPVPAFEVTPGLASMYGNPGTSGNLIPQTLASRLSVEASDEVKAVEGTVRIAAVYQHPDDGRAPDFGYAILQPVPATGLFDTCQATVWPTDQSTINLLNTTLRAVDGAGQQQTKLSQLNPTFGSVDDTVSNYRQRLTRWTPMLGLLIGLIIGFASIRARTLEIASVLHTGFSAVGLVGQLAIETLIWATVGVLLDLPVILFTALQAQAEQQMIVALGCRVLLFGLLGSLSGAAFSASLIKERHLFTLFKAR